MRHQYLLVLTVALCALAVGSSPALKSDLPKAKDPLFNKMLAESDRSVPDAHDPRYNKMLPDPDENVIESDEDDSDLDDEPILPKKAADLNPKYAQRAKQDKSTGPTTINQVKINDDIDSYEEILLNGNGKGVDIDELPQVEDLTGEVLPSITSTDTPVDEVYEDESVSESDEENGSSEIDKELTDPLKTSNSTNADKPTSSTESDQLYSDEFESESDEEIDTLVVDKVLVDPLKSSKSTTTPKSETDELDNDESSSESDEEFDLSGVDKLPVDPLKSSKSSTTSTTTTTTTAKPSSNTEFDDDNYNEDSIESDEEDDYLKPIPSKEPSKTMPSTSTTTVKPTGTTKKINVEILDQYDDDDDADMDYQYNYDDEDDDVDDDEDDDSDDDDGDDGPTEATNVPSAVEKESKKQTKPAKKTKDQNKTANKANDAEYYYYEDEDDDDDYNAESGNMTYCPRGCICERNMHAYMVATCSRLDLETQKFASHITDLQVLDVGPKFPIELGPDFFKKIGLSHVVSIKITNCTIVYISPQAFAGLDELYSVNLSNSGIDMIHPDTFANNTKLRLLTLSGNDLSAMQSVNHNTPYTDYMLKAPSVEELDISRCKLQELQPNAFNELKNIIYINLSENNLSNLPEGLFDNVETIEELDLSTNSIAELPRHIFAKTSLAILHLKHNKISNNVDFVTADLQKLDLSFCQIRTINNQMFKGMDGLTNLILKGNHIEKIKPMAFISLGSLRQIDLSYNNLEQISAQTFIGNKVLDIVRLNNNPRLKRLPNEGFESSYNGTFGVYFMDISNCDISELADNTFKTMPHLTRLNLAWNNLQTIRPAVMAHLGKLMDLDLSNNMITDLDEKTFQINRNLNSLNLAGNQISSLSSKIFHPLQYLSELDISDCDLRTLWEDSSLNAKREEVLPNLKRLNASYNEIAEVFVSDLQSMAKLRVLDIRNNTLSCNDNLQPLINWLQKKQISMADNGQDHVTHADMNVLRTDNSVSLKQWSQFAWEICQGGSGGDPDKTLTYSETEEDYDDDDEDDDDADADVDADVLAKTSKSNKVVDSKNNELLDDYSSESLDSDSADSEDDDDEDEQERENILDDVKGIQKIEEAILTGKHHLDVIDDDSEYEDDSEGANADDVVILESGTFYAVSSFWIVVACILFGLSMILLVVVKVLTVVMKRRGERYRQALLASKNSFVYQKLTEDVVAPKTPKVHRYAPINQV